MELHNIRETVLVVSKGDSILTNDDKLHSRSRINKCTSEEADARLVRHTIDCVGHGYDRVVVRTVDTDLLILLIGNISYMNELGDSTIYALHGSGSTSYYNITEMGLEFGDQVSKALPFQYAFTGCDTTSSFFHIGKCKWFDYWINCPEKDTLTSVFLELSNCPTVITTYHLDILENYVKQLYYNSKENLQSIDLERMYHFSRLPNCNLRNLPFSRLGLVEHTKRTCFQAGWAWVECRENVHLPNVQEWGRHKKEESLVPTWQLPEQPVIDITSVIFTCTCQKSRCKNCKCVRIGVSCLPFCRCQRNCDNPITGL